MSQDAQQSNFPALLDKFKGEIARALPQHLNADRMSRIALTAFRRSPALGRCDPRSVFAAVIQASQLGLEPDTLGRSYLIPYGQECQFVPGWKGLVDLTNRSGNATVWTGAVFEGDEFDWALGDRPYVSHRPAGESDVSKLTHVYAVGRVRGSEYPVIEVWPMKRVMAHRDRYNKVGKRHYSFGNEEMYARKVVLLQVLKYMPSSPELSQAVALNDAAEVGRQRLSVQGAIEGTWVPAEVETPADAGEAVDSPASGAAAGATASNRSDAVKERLRSRSAPAAAAPAGNPDAPTFAHVADLLQKAADVDAVDLAASLISAVDPKHQSELTDMYRARRADLTGDVPL
jgi:recombination protein RecT